MNWRFAMETSAKTHREMVARIGRGEPVEKGKDSWSFLLFDSRRAEGEDCKAARNPSLQTGIIERNQRGGGGGDYTKAAG